MAAAATIVDVFWPPLWASLHFNDAIHYFIHFGRLFAKVRAKTSLNWLKFSRIWCNQHKTPSPSPSLTTPPPHSSKPPTPFSDRRITTTLQKISSASTTLNETEKESEDAETTIVVDCVSEIVTCYDFLFDPSEQWLFLRGGPKRLNVYWTPTWWVDRMTFSAQEILTTIVLTQRNILYLAEDWWPSTPSLCSGLPMLPWPRRCILGVQTVHQDETRQKCPATAWKNTHSADSMHHREWLLLARTQSSNVWVHTLLQPLGWS
jgi:hypothetical protein